MRRLLKKLTTIDKEELGFRAREAVRRSRESVRFRAGRARYDHRRLSRRLQPVSVDVRAAMRHLRAGACREAHAALARHYRTAPKRFVIHPAERSRLGEAISRAFPTAPTEALAACGRLLTGSFDLLGYTNMVYGSAEDPDWHLDPIHRRQAPRTFWARVPYLDPAIGDHKIIWEVNRHQHWLTLGRASWLTGSPEGGRLFVSQLESWLRENPPLMGVNWASMLELAFRMLSWTWALHFFVATDTADAEHPWLVELLTALDEHAEHVARHLSVYFSPNTHLLGEALALYVVGSAFPEFTNAGRWRALGRRVLIEQTGEQVHRDGGHAELSAHYHRYALDFYLLALAVARLNGDPAAERFEATVARMSEFCRELVDAAGVLPTIGDDDGGQLFPICGRRPSDAGDSLGLAACLLGRPEFAVTRSPEEVFWMTAADPALLARGAPGSVTSSPPLARLFPQTGYGIVRSRIARAIIDVGPHGFLNGGHAHADALSVVLSLEDTPLLIDPGTATYTMDERLRNRFRATAMHNTLTLDGRPQSEPGGPFDWRSRTDARVETWRTHADCDYVEGSHDGYRPARHRRGMLRIDADLWLIADHVLSDRPHRVDLHWHVDPVWRLDPRGRSSFVLSHANGRRVTLASTAAHAETFFGDAEGLGWASPLYGQLIPSWTVRATESLHAGGFVVTAISLADHAAVELRAAGVNAHAADGWHRAGIRFERDEEVVAALFTAPNALTSTARAQCSLALAEGQLETDAQVAALRFRNRRLVAAHLFDATTASWKGDQPVTLAATATAGDLHLNHAAIERLSHMPAPLG